MWMGELITDRGIGNGMSVLIFTSTISVIFGQLEQIYLAKGRFDALLAVLVAWVRWIDSNLTYSSPSRVYLVVYFALIVAFTFFYVSITFNPTEIADNMRKYGGFVPGIRPGRPTAEHLRYVLSRLTAPGAVYLGALALFPMIALRLIGMDGQLLASGTSLLIMVGVGLDTVKQIESQLRQHNYEGFLR
jgi:preprotein translocase subunit SecY